VVPTIFTFICFMMPRAEKASCASNHCTVPDLIGGGWRQQLTCNTKRATQLKWVQWYNGLPMVCGTVAAQASNFSRSDASPVHRRSGTPLVRIARHL
jgi:hypothetical protein